MEKITKYMKVSFFTNFFLSIMKVIVGFLGRSSALIADGVHSFSDLVTDVVAIVGSNISSKPADLEHPYGHGKVEYLTSIFIGAVVLFLGFSIISNVVRSGVQIPSNFVLIVSFLTVIIKFFLARFLIKKGKQHRNLILLSSGQESMTDVISSVVVFISCIFMLLKDFFEPFMYADKVAGTIVGILIVRTGFMIIKENINILIGSQESDPNYYEKVKELLLQDPIVQEIDSLIIMKNGFYNSLMIEVSMPSSLSLAEVHDKLHELERKLQDQDERSRYIHIHVNPSE